MQRTQATIALFLSILGMIAGAAIASDEVLGKWQGTVETGRGNYDVTMEFTRSDGGLAGTFASERDGVQTLDGVAYAEGVLTFERSRLSQDGEVIPLSYSAAIDGDSMNVTESTPWGERSFTAKRTRESEHPRTASG